MSKELFRKTIIYVAILVAWLAVCIPLGIKGLMNWIGIVVSFFFAIPTMIVDVMLSIKKYNREQQLSSAAELQDLLKYLDSIKNECIRCNLALERMGPLRQRQPMIISEEIHKTLARSENIVKYSGCIEKLFGRAQTDDLYVKLESNQAEFENELNKVIVDLNPNEYECVYYKLTLSDELKRELYSKNCKHNKEKA